MYLDRQKELNVFLWKLQRVEKEIGVMVRSVTKTDGNKENPYLRLVSCNRKNGFSENLVYRYFLDLAEVSVLVLGEDMEDRRFSLTVNIQKGMCDVGKDEVFQTDSENGEKDCMLDGLEFSKVY